MPRPAGGYRNAAGKRIPGVTTITGRWKESGGLIAWAWKMGRDGRDLNDARDAAADAGTIAHEMIDAHLHGGAFEPDSYAPPLVKSAEHAFLGFLEWFERNKISLVESEVSMISEKYQFGGTFDAAMAGASNGGITMLDFKTSNGIYTEMLIQVAGAYTLLWEENRPGKPITSIDILRVSKPEQPDDPVSFNHCHWSGEIIPIAQRQFILLREAYDLDQRLKKMV